jgi:phosphatidylserine/phosphatidylglycerophosphate/cardiolipin synthase-like enzyme
MRYFTRSIIVALVVGAIFSAARHADFTNFSSLPAFSLGSKASAASPNAAGLYYSPDKNLEHVDVDLISQSSGHLDIAAYSFTNRAIATAVVNAANRGLHVRIYRDYDQYSQEDGRDQFVSELFHGNRNIQIRVKHSRTLMHLKAFSDGNYLRDGSANFSASAKHQDNSLTISKDADQIKAYESKFEEMWSRSDNIVIQ